MFGHFGHQHPLSLNISVGYQDLNSVANILKLSSTVSHQHHDVTNMTVTGQNDAAMMQNHTRSVPAKASL